MKKHIYERSTNYRRNFFNRYHGILGTGIYHCSYCGKLLTKKRLRVDHLIPIYRVKEAGIGRVIMSLHGIRDINDTRNLVPSCESCNSRKGSKMGLWIVRGAVGRHYIFWFILKLTIFAAMIYAFCMNRDSIQRFIKNFADRL